MKKNNMPDVIRGSRGDFWNWDPIREFGTLRRQMDRLFENFLEPFTSTGGEPSMLTAMPACDIEETEGHYLITFDLPGVSKNDLKVEVVDNQLVVTAERKREYKEDEKRSSHFTERYYGKFQRVFTLPAGVDAGRIEADYSDGVLKIAFPKTEEVKSQQIKIGEKKEGGFFTKLLGKKEEKKQVA